MKDIYLFMDYSLAAVDPDAAYEEARERAAGFFDDDESEANEDETNCCKGIEKKGP